MMYEDGYPWYGVYIVVFIIGFVLGRWSAMRDYQ